MNWTENLIITRCRFGTILILLAFLAACSTPVTPTISPSPDPTSTTPVILIPTATIPPEATETPAPEISPTASTYLEAAIEIMKTNGLYRNELDWDSLREKAFLMAQHAQTEAETYDAIRFVLMEAGGEHSKLLTPEEAEELSQSSMEDSPAPRGKLLMDKLGYIAIGGFKSIKPYDGAQYAKTIQEIIRHYDKQNPCGWVVDLRENTGGNMWPMLAGIGPLLGDGKAGEFIDPDGVVYEWSYTEGKSLIGDYVLTKVPGINYQLKTVNPPVAVLTGEKTASSGEAIVVAFRGRPQTRSFGTATKGMSTGNEGFPLSDGALLLLTGVTFVDRTGQIYGERIPPDEEVDAQNNTTIMEETIPQAAVDWLLDQPACAGR